MRNAALVLGLIAGVFGMIVGFFGYGYTVAIEQWGEIEGWARQVDNVELIRAASFFAPMLCIAGGAMARARALWSRMPSNIRCTSGTRTNGRAIRRLS